MESLEAYFTPFRENVIGNDLYFEGPYGRKKIIYADWTASGRLYQPIEDILTHDIAPYVANTHTETTLTGCAMTLAYKQAKKIIKEHVGATSQDILISSNSGMTGVVNKLQRILGLKLHEKYHGRISLPERERPVIFISHMEHHSNQTSWLETLADVEIIPPNEEGLMDLTSLKNLLEKYSDRTLKIAAVTSCSNVTGIMTPYHEVAEIMHDHGGYCFVDFACSAPYIDIDMRPQNPKQILDAIYFSPHKFLGGPGSSGILIFNAALYHNRVPDNPGGGTVDWTNPWGEHKYLEEIEAREDGGTPAFLQTIKVALCIQLKDKMQTSKMQAREHQILERIWRGLDPIKGLHFLADKQRDRLGVISFYTEGLHYNLFVKLLNDRFGIQVRGGCSCAGTYGHYLLNVSPEISNEITSRINEGDLSVKPGWVRLSIHPVMTDDEIDLIVSAISAVVANHETWARDYKYDNRTNEYHHFTGVLPESELIQDWFSKDLQKPASSYESILR